jgi:E3 ubiquitin-protein ligase ZNF598
MADTTQTLVAQTSSRPTQGQRGNRRPRGGSHEAQSFKGRPGREGAPRGQRGQGGGRGRGRSQQNGPTTVAPNQQSHTNIGGLPGLPARGTFGSSLTEDASKPQGDKLGQDAAADEGAVAEEEGEVCFICASPIEHNSIAPCNHQTCHICALRLRALYKTRACAHCRTEAPYVVFTDDASKRYEDFKDEEMTKIDENLGIKYEKDEIFEDTVLLLRYNCPDKDCDVACLGWLDLHRHVKNKHSKVMCDLCTRNKKVFTHEHDLFTYSELRKHERYGDDNPGAIDQSGFKGHPECGFCKQRFYGDDELYTHCREKHERCHICDRRNGGANPQYYLNYQELEKHFAEAHFVCLDAECVANKTNVFENEMDLKAHQLSAHPNGLSKDARRDVRLVNLSGFDVRTPYQPERRGGREHRGNGRGRDPNAEPLPQSSAQPIGRAELAYQRQMAIQRAQSVSTRNFGGQLTQAVPAPRAQPRPAQRSTPASPLPAMASLSVDESPAPAPSTPQDIARQARHNQVISRASTLLDNNATKLSFFRTHVSSYKSGTKTASDLIDSIFSLFDAPTSELGKLIRELADLYEDETKRQQLLTAWNDWRSINEDYPSLPVPAGGSASSSFPASSGRRVLKLKSSTAQSSRSAVSRQGSWGNSLDRPAAASTPGNPFPALPFSSRKPVREPLAWATGTVASRPTASVHSVPSMAAPRTMGPRANDEMFPSLPAAAKPNVLIGGTTKGSVRWGGSAPTNTFSWGSSNANGGSNGPTPSGSGTVTPAAEEPNGLSGKKGKGKKGKEVLYRFG